MSTDTGILRRREALHRGEEWTGISADERASRVRSEVDLAALERELRGSIDGEVRFDDQSRGLYSTDAANYRAIPLGVVVPRTAEDVVAAVEIARRYRAPITGRGGGTSLAKYKSEFLAHHYAGRLRPRSAYAMGLVGWWARLGALAPGLANAATSTEPFASLAKAAAGVSQHRSLPRFASRTFSRWFRGRPRPDVPAGAKDVLLCPDVFHDYFDPVPLVAATEALERLGYRVHVPSARPRAVRPLIHFGMLDLAKRELRKLLRELAPYVRESVPVVGLEPSTISVLREELPDLLHDVEDARRLSRQSVLLSELLAEEDVELPRVDGMRVVHHGHCHQKAVLRATAAVQVLERMGCEVEEPEEGCCGMAGAFGLEEDHYEVSTRIGELRLLPAVREAGDALVVADGFSCRSQIAEGTGRQPIHLAELVRGALASRGERPRHRPARSLARRLAPAGAALVGAAAAGVLFARTAGGER